MNKFLSSIQIHESFMPFIKENKLLIDEIYDVVTKEEYTPKTERVLRFLEMDLSNIKVIILGQDPYPTIVNGQNTATGRAFEVSQLNDYHQPFKQVSLKNMVRLIHKTYKGIDNYSDIYKFKDVIDDEDFKILPHHDWYDSLEKQGVLFLNTSLTTLIDKPMSHVEYWNPFTIKLLNYIGSNNPNITYFLWGSNANKYQEYIKGKIIASRHPMMCSAKYEDDFLKSTCFKETMNEINWLG